jgi:CheY-like chemotaxis protein
MMPYGSVLVVDDVDINLYVASEILLSYKLEVETADSGFVAIEKIENGKKYDVIFMDHMMPKMDGIETTKKLRELGYTGFIVALTANALVGNDKIFAQNGFDGFITKPIDIKQINTILNKFVRDMHPEEAKR